MLHAKEAVYLAMSRGRELFRSVAVIVVFAGLGAIVGALLSGAKGVWTLVGAVVGAVSSGLAPIVADAVSKRRRARKTLADIQELRPPLSSEPPLPSDLLSPHWAVIPFIGRNEELRRLTAWCQNEHAGKVRLVTGAGGTGKTRLALQLVSKLTPLAGGVYG